MKSNYDESFSKYKRVVLIIKSKILNQYVEELMYWSWQFYLQCIITVLLRTYSDIFTIFEVGHFLWHFMLNISYDTSCLIVRMPLHVEHFLLTFMLNSSYDTSC